MAKQIEVWVWRGRETGEYVAYEVPLERNQTVLDVVTFIQRHLDSTLSYRFACRVGMCGSCAMTVNGTPRWTCRTHVTTVLGAGTKMEVGPLRNLPVIKDLAVDMAPFFDKWAAAHGSFQGNTKGERKFTRVRPDSPQRRAVDEAIECIGCAVCYAACDVVTWKHEYLGPAALNRAWSLVHDVRDQDNPARLRSVSGDAGCHACHSHQSCATYCPMHLNPTASIAGLKRASVRNLVERFLGLTSSPAISSPEDCE